MMVRSETVPGFSHFSVNPAVPSDGEDIQRRGFNMSLDWSSSWKPLTDLCGDDCPPVDQVHHWAMVVTTRGTQAGVVDITPRRLQNLVISPNQVVQARYQQGQGSWVDLSLTADPWGLVTIPDVPVAPNEPTRVEVTVPTP
jgi:hypothetical protein